MTTRVRFSMTATFNHITVYFDREQLDKEIAKAAETVAAELQGDPVKTKTELLSQTEKLAEITMEQKLGKAPKTKTDLLSRIKQQAEIKMAQKLIEVPHTETAEQKVSKATKLAESTGRILSLLCFIMKHLIMSHIMRKQDFCICENKCAYQLCNDCTADQHLCALLIPKISRFYLSSVGLLASLCWTWSHRSFLAHLSRRLTR